MKLLPSPSTRLGGCVWLPRILAKARLKADGRLPEDYAARFCHPGGVDSQFLSFFKIAREELFVVCRLNDDGVAAWFRALDSASDARIEEWNHIALNLGRPGFPMADRLPIALATSYQHLAGKNLQTVFAVLEADEAG